MSRVSWRLGNSVYVRIHVNAITLIKGGFFFSKIFPVSGKRSHICSK